MSVSELIKKFDVRKHVPVDVNDVVDEIKARGIKDNITFWPVTLETDRLKGQLVHIDEWDEPGFEGAPTKTWADVYFSKDMPDDEQRLVSCKELLHILDPAHCLTGTQEQIDKLFGKIGLPPEMQNAMKDGPDVNLDRIAEYLAAAVLFPWATRQLLLKPYAEGKFTLEDIARMVDIPYKYVAFVMHESWEAVHTILLATNGDHANG